MNISLRKMMVTLLAAAVIAVPSIVLTAGGDTAYAASAATNTPIQVKVDGVLLKLTQPSYEKNGATLVQMKPIFDALHTELTWVQETHTVFAAKYGISISLQVGAGYGIVNGKSIKLQTPVEVKNGSTMVPLRFVSEALGATLDWNAKTRMISIRSAEAQQFETEQEEGSTPIPEPSEMKASLTGTEVAALNDEKVVMLMTDIAQGSGVIIGDRLILTNYHVMANAKTASVYLSDGTKLDVQGVAGYDKDSDLAVILTKSSIGADPVTLGDGSEVDKGDVIYAIGSPLGLRNTLSSGLISNIVMEKSILYYQISAPIDHGSSGGGLFNDQGELIGITSSGIDDTQADLNFAISIGHVQRLLAKMAASMTPQSEVGFLPGSLPDSLAGASMDEIRRTIKETYSELQTSQGTATFDNWTVTRDNQGWLVITAEIDPDFYTFYGTKTADELKNFMLNMGSSLKRMLSGEHIQVLVYYEETLDFEPRGFAADQVTALGDDKWKLRYPVIDMQFKDKVYITVRT